MKREERRLSLPEAAEALGVSEITARRWIKSGKLRASQPGRNYQVPESAVEELLEPAPKEGPPPPSDSGGTGESRRIADSIPIPDPLDSINVVDVAREAVLADKRRKKQWLARLHESGEGQTIYSSVGQELERRLGELFAERGSEQSFFGGLMYSGLLNSVRRTLELEEENARLEEELAEQREEIKT